jgi:hypothetical protein
MPIGRKNFGMGAVASLLFARTIDEKRPRTR